MISLRHSWGWQPPQTAPHMYLTHIQSGWAQWYAVCWHMAVPSNSYTHTTGSYYGVLGHLWSQNDIITSWLRLTATSTTAYRIHTRHIQSVWAHWYAVHGHMAAALNNHTQTTWLIFWGSGSLVESNDDFTSWLRLTASSNFFLHPHWHIQSVWAHWYAFPGDMAVASNSYTCNNHLYVYVGKMGDHIL